MSNATDVLGDFVSEYLGGDIQKLATFDFAGLKGTRFGCVGRGFDCDDTELTRAIAIILWGGDFPNLDFENFGTDNLYRCDTMNSFHTLFGSQNDMGRFDGLEHYNPSDEMRRRVADFYRTYHTIGNFVLLPNLRTGGDSINTYRGVRSGWADYFDAFIRNLYLCMTGNRAADEPLGRLIEHNRHFFDAIGNDFDRFIDVLMLGAWVDENGRPKDMFRICRYWPWKNQNADEYIKNARKYIDCATAIIRQRGARIIARLDDAM